MIVFILFVFVALAMLTIPCPSKTAQLTPPGTIDLVDMFSG
jgi:hypothetical protein